MNREQKRCAFKANFSNFMKNIIHLILHYERTINEVPAPTASLSVSLNKLQLHCLLRYIIWGKNCSFHFYLLKKKIEEKPYAYCLLTNEELSNNLLVTYVTFLNIWICDSTKTSPNYSISQHDSNSYRIKIINKFSYIN